MRYESDAALMDSIGVEICQPLPAPPETRSPSPPWTLSPQIAAPAAVRRDGVAAGLVAAECCRNGMPAGAVVRSIAAAFELPAAVVALHLGRARRKRPGRHAVKLAAPIRFDRMK